MLKQIGDEHGKIDFLVHSIAFADKDWLQPGRFVATPREVFAQAMDISAYTYGAMANHAAPLMTDGGSMIALSYYGAEKAVPGYNVMGVTKAALEATTRYLAMELGEKGIRANCICPGAVDTPLLALIRDQLQQLPQGLRGACLTGDMTPAEQRQVIRLMQPPKP